MLPAVLRIHAVQATTAVLAAALTGFGKTAAELQMCADSAHWCPMLLLARRTHAVLLTIAVSVPVLTAIIL